MKKIIPILLLLFVGVVFGQVIPPPQPPSGGSQTNSYRFNNTQFLTANVTNISILNGALLTNVVLKTPANTSFTNLGALLFTNRGGLANYVATYDNNQVLTNTWVSTTNLSDSVQATTNFFSVSNGVSYILIGSPFASSGAAQQYTNGSYTGWGGWIGAPQWIDRITFYVCQWDGSSPITTVSARLRKDGPFGSIISSNSTSVTPVTGTPLGVSLDLGQTLYNAEQANLWLEFTCNGKSGFYGKSTGTYDFPSYPIGRYYTVLTPGAPGNSLRLGATTNCNMFVTYERSLGTGSTLLTSAAELLVQGAGAKLTGATNLIFPEVSVYLPLTNYFTPGSQGNLFYKNFIRSTVPLESLEILLTCSKGSVLDDNWTYTPTQAEVGTYQMNFEVKWNGMSLYNRPSWVKVASTNAGIAVNRKVLIIGDSLTANAIWPAYLATNFANLPMDITFIGTQGPVGQKTEGYSGYRWNTFATNSSSPFVFGGVFNFATYLATNSFTMASGDWVLFEIGINDVFTETSDANALLNTQAAMAYSQMMVSNITATVSGIRIGFLGITPFASQTAFGLNYGTRSQKQSLRNRDIYQANMLANWENGCPNNLGVWAGTSGQLDGQHNMQWQTFRPNANNPQMVYQQIDAVHPDEPGYIDMADAVRNFLIGQE
jgi:lysophospholipase L1-like esterase